MAVKIGYLFRFDPRNIRSWSGTRHFMGKALEKHAGEVVYFPLDTRRLTRAIMRTPANVNEVSQKWIGKTLLVDQNRILSHRVGRFLEAQLRRQPCDVLFAPAASIEVAYLRTEIPIVYYSDLTWRLIEDYYPEYDTVPQVVKREANRLEALSIAKSAAIAYPSDWALESAITHYGAAPDKVYKVPFGANLAEVPTREAALQHPLRGTVNLLWVGVDWQRKGGIVAVECLKALLEKGIDAQLTVCGISPPDGVSHPRMRVVPFLDKTVVENQRKLSQFFLDAHFLLFPTRADASPIVLCESGAHGLPSVVRDTGGIRGHVTDGVNGFLIPEESGGRAYAEKIAASVSDPAGYQKLVESSRDEYELNLNWDHWGCSMRSIMERVLHRHMDSPAIESSDAEPSTTTV